MSDMQILHALLMVPMPLPWTCNGNMLPQLLCAERC
jgi:hypothetical protein